MKNNKLRIALIVLTAVIFLALIPWIFILTGNLAKDTEPPEATPAAGEHMTETPPAAQQPLTPAVEQPLPAVTPLPPAAEQPPPTPEPVLEERVIDIAMEHPDLAQELDRIAADFNCVAVSLVIYDGDKKEFFDYQYGFADTGAKRRVDADTKFRVASLSKLATVMCAMILVDEKIIDLDEDISQYLGFRVRNPGFPDTPITSRMLMQHTSSIHDSSDFLASRQRSSSRSAKQLLDSGTSYQRVMPGTEFEYTNFGYSVLAAVCEVAYGKAFDLMARELLFEPMGIDAAYVPNRLSDTSNIANMYTANHALRRSVQAMLGMRDSSEIGRDVHLAQGSLVISMIDYARLLAMLGNAGIYEDVSILSAASAREINNTIERGEEFDRGLSTRRSELEFMPRGEAFWHTGSAYGTFAQYLQSVDGSNRGVVVITTGARTERLPGGMVIVCTELSEAAWTRLGF